MGLLPAAGCRLPDDRNTSVGDDGGCHPRAAAVAAVAAVSPFRRFAVSPFRRANASPRPST
ncbi:hypothetical protein WS62_29255 [Burkholderia sp. ABCPW 14]|nr:hypothetical protein WS62_29255 [Burkholderia sp. ABCPW 14]